jgi:hypothetical protein
VLPTLDTQAIEILGRNKLVDDLTLAGLEVALPLRDRGVDLLAYHELAEVNARFIAVPIQLKASSLRSFSVSAKYAKISNLVMAHVWGLQSPQHAACYALTYQEAYGVAQRLGWLDTPTWVAKGIYTTNNPSARVMEQLEPFKMTPAAWAQKIREVSAVTPPERRLRP